MNKLIVVFTFIIVSSMSTNVFAKKTSKDNNGEKIFLKYADECLEKIGIAADEISITGAAMVTYIPGDKTEAWISKMKVMGRISSGKFNFLAVIYAKAAEMAITLKDSGNKDRKDIIGELGYQGGVIMKVKSGYLLAAFSGGTGEQDAAVSRKGLEWLAKKF